MRCLTCFGLLCALAAAQEKDLVTQLLELEAPPRDWKTDPIVKAYGKLAPPPDDAPLSALLDYWSTFGSHGRRAEPSAKVRRRIFAACRAEPRLLQQLWMSLPRTKEARRFAEEWWEREGRHLWLEEFEFEESDEELAQLAEEDADALVELARRDWQVALPLVRRHAAGEDEVLAVGARILLLRHGEATARDQLRAVVDDRDADPYARNWALFALLDHPWEGWERWYLSLFADPEIDPHYAVARDPDRWIPAVSKVVGDEDPVVHNHAVQCLILFTGESARADALRPLLPWLKDAGWANDREDDRLRLIQSVDRVPLPECAPGLVHILGSGEEDSVLEYALEAIGHYRVKEAAPLLRQRLQGGAELDRGFCTALLRSGALTVQEQIEAVTAYARARAAGRADEFRTEFTELSRQERLGLNLAFDVSESETVAAVLLRRAATLPQLADIVHRWSGSASDLDIVRRIARGEAAAASVVAALERREEVQAHAEAELRQLLAHRGAARGIAAALLEAPRSVLASDDREAQRALLACARLIRQRLPLDAVARRLPDEAAEAYLVALDTPEARRHLSGRIVGADPWERSDRKMVALRKEVGAGELFALVSSTDDGLEYRVVLLHDGRLVLRWMGDPARHRARTLTGAESEGLLGFVRRHSVDELPPVPYLADDGIDYYYLHLTPKGGWRVHMNNPRDAEDSDLYTMLVRKFERLTEQGRFETRYEVVRRVPGVEVLRTGGVVDVWADGKDVRVLDGEWQTLAGSQAAPPAWPTTGVRFMESTVGTWRAELGDGRLLDGRGWEGLWIHEGGQDPRPIRKGPCAYPVITPDRRWLLLAVAVQHWGEPNGVVRIDLKTLESFELDLRPRHTNNPIAYLPAHKKVLLHRHAEGRMGAAEGSEYVLVDPASGRTEPVGGVFWPLLQSGLSRRGLQPTGRPHEYWAARPTRAGTEVGRYDARLFRFTSVARYPALPFESRDMWIDAPFVYVVYDRDGPPEGDLLRLPLR